MTWLYLSGWWCCCWCYWRISHPTFLPLMRTGLPREKAGQVSGYFERSRRTSQDAGSNPYDPDPTIHTHRVVLRADVFRFSLGCVIAQSPSLHLLLQPLPHLALPVLDHHCFSILHSDLCAEKCAICAVCSAQFRGDCAGTDRGKWPAQEGWFIR